MKIIPRSEWKARAPKWRNEGNLDDPSTGHWNGPTIVLSGKKTWDHSKCGSILRGIQNFHMDFQNWSDIAYNFAVCPHRYIFELRGLDVINGANGTNDGNRSSHAIFFFAGEGNPFTEEEKAGFRECVRYISERTSAPDAAIGHRDHKPTTCPGDARYNWIHDGMPVKSKQKTNVEKETIMQTAILLIKIHYGNVRGNGRGAGYDVPKEDPTGWAYWLNTLLEAQDKGEPLKGVTDFCAYLLVTKG